MKWKTFKNETLEDYKAYIFYNSKNKVMFQANWKENIVQEDIDNGRATHFIELPQPPND